MKSKLAASLFVLLLLGLGFALLFEEIFDHLRVFYIAYFAILYFWGSRLIANQGLAPSKTAFQLILFGLATGVASLRAIFTYHSSNWFDFTLPSYVLAILATHLVIFGIFAARSYKNNQKQVTSESRQAVVSVTNRALVYLLLLSLVITFYGRLVTLTATLFANQSICYAIPVPDEQYRCLKKLQYY